MEEKEEEYKKKIDELIKKIKKITSPELDDVKRLDEEKYKDLTEEDLNVIKSDEIMKLIRKEYLFIHPIYIRDKVTENTKATLDFNNQNIKFTVTEDEKKFYCKLHANSFGPFNPEAYFKSDDKILWLLKEPLIKGIENWIWNKDCKGPDRGGHDQAKEYNKWETMKDTNDTKEHVVRRTQKILSIIDEKGGWDVDSDETYQKVMDHICILEVQHFPGLAFSSSNSDDGNKNAKLRKWAELNKPLYEALIKFYNPTIIIGGYTLPYLFYYNDNKDNLWMLCDLKDEKTRYQQIEELIENLEEGLKLLDNKIIAYFHVKDKFYPEEIKEYPVEYPEDYEHLAYLDDKGIIYIDAYHPAPKKFKTYEYTDAKAQIDAQRINILKNYMKNIRGK